MSTRFRKGDVREDGRIFVTNAYGKDRWATVESYHRGHVSKTCSMAKTRALKRGVPHTVDSEYLVSIFPKDFKCPVFGTEMSWGGDKMTSPSLDRIHPALGYVRGNLIWVSNYANVLKSGNSLETLETLLSFYRNLQSGKNENTG